MEDKKILVADDSAFMRKVLIDILNNAGFKNIEEAENGKQVLEKNKEGSFDLILLDIIMPEVDGIEVVKQIGKEANIIIISAIGQDGVITEAKENGAKGFIVKPFENDKVLEEVNRVIAE